MKEMLSVVSLSEVLDHIGFNAADEADIRDYGFSPRVTWGDARYTLVGPRFALDRILYALDAVCYESGTPSRAILTAEDITTRYWSIVTEDDFIDLEN